MATYQVPREFAYGGSYVDETLFGESRAQKTAARRRAGQSMVGRTKEKDVLRLTRQEFEEIKRRANTPLAALAQTSNPRPKREHRTKIAMLHKARPTPAEEYERQYRETVGVGGANIRAFELRNEELDEVKELQSHLTVMQVKAEVDQGLALKKRRQAEIEAYERRKEEEMEVERQRQMRLEAEKQTRHRQQTKAAQQELLLQVAHNKKLELLEEERLAQENKQMRAHLAHLEAIDAQKRQRQQEAQIQRNIELAKANKMAERYRVIAQEQSEKEDRDIAEYLRRKAAAEEYRRRQAEKLREEEELNVARMRELQEKHQDKQAEEDAKKAHQYQEQRQLREEEELAARAKKRADMQASVLQELEQQKRLKHRLRQEEQEYDAEYTERLRREAAAVSQRRNMEQHQRLEAREKYKKDLVSLISSRKSEREEAERQQLEADRVNALEGEVYKHRVKLVMDKKLREHAKHYPVPARYMPGAEEQRLEKKKATQKFQKTRALW